MKQPDFLDKMKSSNQEMFQQTTKLDREFEILNENDQCSHVLFLLSGEIEVYKISENGKVFQLYSIHEGESCVLNLSCILSNHHYMAFAKAVTDIECVLIPRQHFLNMFHEEESLRQYVFELISSRLIQITAKVEGIVLDTLENRLRNFLLDQNKSMVYITHGELANQLGSVREVISRQLKKWEKDKKVELCRGKIKILNL